MTQEPRRPLPGPRLTLVELVGMVVVFAAYNATFAAIFRRMRAPAAPLAFSRSAVLATVAVNLVIAAPMGLALAVRWGGDLGRRRSGQAPARDDLLALTETVLLGVLAASALVRLVLWRDEPPSLLAAALGIPLLFAAVLGLGLTFLHLVLRQFADGPGRADGEPPLDPPPGAP